MKTKCIIIAVLLTTVSGGSDRTAEKPLMRDFIGINGHFHFKPELYKQVCHLVRNYHNMDWDVARPGSPITLPRCVNGVDWVSHVYGPWRAAGFEIDICTLFGDFGPKDPNYTLLWQDQQSWAYQYGREMSRQFGPSGTRKLATSIEIGNEPGQPFDDALYRRVFTGMAKGIRAGDPRMKIVTCTAWAGQADPYMKSLDETFASPEILPLYDVINLHVYAMLPKQAGRSPWDRSYPEDPNIDFLKIVDRAIQWRDEHARDKEIWITEFGWDACSDEAMKGRTGWFAKLNWTDVTDLQQAQYLVRSILCFAARAVDRAYIYYYNDDDQASVHAASGLTRRFEPKVAFWALKQLFATLGNYRFQRIVRQEPGRVCLYEFTEVGAGQGLIWVVWSPTGSDRQEEMVLDDLPGQILKVTSMATAEGPAGSLPIIQPTPGSCRLRVTESPLFLSFNSTSVKSGGVDD